MEKRRPLTSFLQIISYLPPSALALPFETGSKGPDQLLTQNLQMTILDSQRNNSQSNKPMEQRAPQERCQSICPQARKEPISEAPANASFRGQHSWP